MKKLGLRIVSVTIIVAFFISQIILYTENKVNVPPHAFDRIFVKCMILYMLYAFLLLRYMGNEWRVIEKILLGVNVISMIMVCFISVGIDIIPVVVINMLAIASASLGIAGLWHNKNKINEAFILWAIFIYIWVNALDALLCLYS